MTGRQRHGITGGGASGFHAQERSAENHRRDTNKSRVLAYLQAHGSATNAELMEIGGFRAMARVWEIGKDYQVEVVKLKGGLWRVDYKGPKPIPSLLELMGRSA